MEWHGGQVGMKTKEMGTNWNVDKTEGECKTEKEWIQRGMNKEIGKQDKGEENREGRECQRERMDVK